MVKYKLNTIVKSVYYAIQMGRNSIFIFEGIWKKKTFPEQPCNEAPNFFH
jgi:hypothetical protein